jgi:Aspartyl protease
MIFDRRWRRSTVAALLVAVLGAFGCGSSDEVLPPLWMGRSGERLPASTASNVFWVQADVNGTPGPQAIVDTGAPITLFHVGAFHGAVELGVGRVTTLTLGATTLWKVPTVGDDGGDSLTPTGKIDGGIIGFTAYGQFEMSFDYRASQIVIGAAAPPDGLAAPVQVAFSLEGGGRGSVPGGEVIVFPASRVVLPATIEGRNVSLLLDTGASWVALRTDIYQSIVEDGRGQVTLEAMLAQGTTKTNVARLRSVVVAGAEVKRASSAAAPVLDALIDSLAKEVGQPVDGLLGAPYLREFYVVVDYPNRTLRLYRYPDASHVVDEYQKVGIELGGVLSPGGNRFFVRIVYPGTDAARQGINLMESLVAIDGQLLSGLDFATAERKLHGPVGTTKQLQFAGRTVDVLVDDLLPLP